MSKSTCPKPLFDSLQNLLNNELVYELDMDMDNFDDYNYAREFLLMFRGNDATFNAYRREVERLLQWCHIKAHKQLKELRRADFELYLDFCKNPPKSWIGNKKVPRFIDANGKRIPNQDWRPFVVTYSKVEVAKGKISNTDDYSLSEKAFREIFSVISSFYNFLIQENHTEINPALQIRQKNKYFRKENKSSHIIRKLSDLQWGYVIETAEIMAQENPDKHHRTLFIMSALYGMYLRISELSASKRWTPTMGDFFRDPDGLWWFKTIGKGNKERIVSVSNDMLKAFKRFRQSLGLTSLPSPGDKTPLIPKLTGKGAMKSVRTIRELVQECFDQAAERLKSHGLIDEAEQVMAATAHWLRHTGISDDVKIRPREHVRDDAGHSSGAITDKYIDVEKRERNASAKRKKIVPECMANDTNQ
ncbi:MAG: site-specific integrase [Gammaproteobacteria bacterium]|nr:site-specific integrase [Gammaproteobacteria bacterium]